MTVPIKKQPIILLFILATISLASLVCTSPDTPKNNVPILTTDGRQFAGSATCQSCHAGIYKSHTATAHFRDSRPAAKEYIKGSFDDGKNRIIYNDSSEVTMQRQNGLFFQTATKNGAVTHRKPFDLVIGSGRKGQTYLYWDDGKLLQLPVSYHSPSDSWCNSPGYPVKTPFFDRQISSFCLECHATNARTAFRGSDDYAEHFDKTQLIYGIDCERCHGPAAAHVDFHTAHPGEKTGKYILNTHNMTRQQKLDACALCHSGSRSPLKPAFSFIVGDTLDHFSQARYSQDSVATLDVHANQYGLLTSSKCFKNSQMTCASCHNTHDNEAGQLQLYSQRCMTCHNTSTHNTCTMQNTPALVLANNCIDCHMPTLPSKKITLRLSSPNHPGQAIPDEVRTHHIAIYRR